MQKIPVDGSTPDDLPHMHCHILGYHCNHKVEAQRFVIEALRRPNAPSHCGTCLLGALTIAVPNQSNKAALDNSQTSRGPRRGLGHRRGGSQGIKDLEGEFWKTLLHFLLYPRSAEEIQHLLLRLLDSSLCACSNQGVELSFCDIFWRNQRLARGERLKAQDYHLQGRAQHHLITISTTYLDRIADACTLERLSPSYSRYDVPRRVGLPGRVVGLRNIVIKSEATESASYWPSSTDISHSDREDHATTLIPTLVESRPFISNGGTGGVFIVSAMKALATQIHSGSSRSTSLGRARCWPYSSKDLLPGVSPNDSDDSEGKARMEHAASEFASSLALWMAMIEDTSIANFAAEALSVVGPLMIPALVKHNFAFNCLLAPIRRIILKTLHAVEFIDASEPAERQLSSKAEVGWAMTSQLDNVWAFFEVLFLQFASTWREKLFSEVEMMTVEASSLALYMYDDASWPRRLRKSDFFLAGRRLAVKAGKYFRTLGLRIIQKQGLVFFMGVHPELGIPWPSEFETEVLNQSSVVATLDNPPESFDSDFQFDSSQLSPSVFHTVLASYILNLGKQNSCDAFGCDASIHTVGRAFKECAQCRVARYCSKQCQKLSWKGQVTADEKEQSIASHAEVCSIFKALRANAVGETASQVVEHWNAVCIEVSDTQFKAAFDWLTAVQEDGASSSASKTTGWEDYSSLLQELEFITGVNEHNYLGYMSLELIESLTTAERYVVEQAILSDPFVGS